MSTSHSKYRRIVVDGFADGAVPEAAYRDVMGPAGPSLVRARQYEQRVVGLINELAMYLVGAALLNRLNEDISKR